ncbi:MAG TPA: hypothetical protein VHS08_03985, partial [Candidatus Acidoferrales bacterium]|nr:hypothetical protein [Candidatus Acidoferrales bacterium]
LNRLAASEYVLGIVALGELVVGAVTISAPALLETTVAIVVEAAIELAPVVVPEMIVCISGRRLKETAVASSEIHPDRESSLCKHRASSQKHHRQQFRFHK